MFLIKILLNTTKFPWEMFWMQSNSDIRKMALKHALFSKFASSLFSTSFFFVVVVYLSTAEAFH